MLNYFHIYFVRNENLRQGLIMFNFQFSTATEKLYAARNKVVSLTVTTGVLTNRDSGKNNGRQDKENLTLRENTCNKEQVNREPQKLWLRLLLVYGSNQHFVKPVTVCQQHRKEKVSSKSNLIENGPSIKENEPINLSKSYSDNVILSEVEVSQ